MARLRYTLGAAFVVFLIAQSAAAPLDDDRPEIIEIIAPARAAQEALDSLNLGEPNYDKSERNKRSIGVLREMFPEISKLVDRKVQEIAEYLVKTAGPTVLQSLLGGGGGGLFGGGGGGSMSSASGTVSGGFSPDDSDEDDTESKPSASSGSKISVSLPTFAPVDDSDDEDASVASKSGTAAKLTEENKDEAETINLIPRIGGKKDEADNETDPEKRRKRATSGGNQLDGAESQNREVRVEFVEDASDPKVRNARKSDQEPAAAENNDQALDDLTLDNVENSEENRDKRLVSFGFGGGANSGGSGGGSGNFLFDIIRRPAEAMARGLGTAFRVITGTDSINLGIMATHTSTSDSPLVAGSGGTDQVDDSGKDASAADGEIKGDGYTEGIPGPVTRLFIIANRGISNLIQDLILRIAQTSERLVNFKARLITSII